MGKATDLLKRVQQFAQKIHLSMAQGDKRLKNAEILLSHTAFRLTEMLHASSLDDKPVVQDTQVSGIGGSLQSHEALPV